MSLCHHCWKKLPPNSRQVLCRACREQLTLNNYTEVTKMNQKPEHKVKVGAVTASIWKREVKKNGNTFTVRQVSLDRTYKDKNDEWQSTNSYDTNDIPKAILALSRAYQGILDAAKSDANGDGDVVVEDVN